MRALFILLLIAAIPAFAQVPAVRLINTTRPASHEFQVGDRFEVVVTGAANQPVSVRTVRGNRVDWSPVIAWTDSRGQWSTTGEFEKRDFGSWTELWTVGGKLANPTVSISVHAPCLKGRPDIVTVFSLNVHESCETTEGLQSFAMPSDSDAFRTPDGRLVPERRRLMH